MIRNAKEKQGGNVHNNKKHKKTSEKKKETLWAY
jgi:hypothetical protein